MTDLCGISHREQDLQRRVELVKDQLRELRMSNDSNQAKLLDHSQRQGSPLLHLPALLLLT